MLDYTREAFKKTVEDLKRVFYILNVTVQCVYIAYLVYTLIVGTGFFAVNLALLVLSVAYLGFFLVTTAFGKTPEGKIYRKIGKRVYKWCKRALKLFTIGVTVYGICNAVNRVSPLAVIFTAMMIVGLLLQVVFEILISIVSKRAKMFLEGFEADVNAILKPARSVGNFFKRMTGQEVEPEKELTENQLLLKERVDEAREEKRQLRATEKEERKALREAQKERAKELKKSVALEKKLLKNAAKKNKTAETEVAFGEEE